MSARLAPEIVARAEQSRAQAYRARASGDEVGAALYGEEAMAVYERAVAVVRIAQATLESADAQKALDDGTAQLRALESSRAKLEDDSAELEKRVQIARQRLRTAASGRASPEREAARRTASAALVTEARLICDAAKLVAAGPDGLAAAQAAIATVAQQMEAAHGGPRSAPIDAAAQSRADCLEVLSRARRTSAKSDALVDQLFAELSATGAFSPNADERGVVVTLRGAFQGAGLTDAASGRLAELGRVAAAHPSFAVQVVVHDASPPSANDVRDARRAEAAVRVLAAGGADASTFASELAGARVPVADPADPTSRARNERLDVVFVAR